MPLTHAMKQTIDQDATDQRNQLATATRPRVRKAPGTRLGIIQDWRLATTGKAAIRFGCAIREGR